jgi:hypothetical protein
LEEIGGGGAEEAVPPGASNVKRLEHSVHPSEREGSVKQTREAMAVVVIFNKTE